MHRPRREFSKNFTSNIHFHPHRLLNPFGNSKLWNDESMRPKKAYSIQTIIYAAFIVSLDMTNLSILRMYFKHWCAQLIVPVHHNYISRASEDVYLCSTALIWDLENKDKSLHINRKHDCNCENILEKIEM